MHGSFFNAVRNYPRQSVLISTLIIGICTFESGIFSNPPMEMENPEIAISRQDHAPMTESARIQRARRSFETVAEEDVAYNAEGSMRNVDPKLARLLIDNNYKELREELLQIASAAVAQGDKKRLGYILNLLGQVSIRENDLYSADVYLMEALDIFTKLDDQVGLAQIHLQLGRIHLKSRQTARIAGTAYDELQVGRWYLAKGLLDNAKQYITKSIDRNLSINRYGSAASAYQSLARLYLELNDDFHAGQAVFESARMFAASGNIFRAKNALKLLPASRDWQLAELNRQIESHIQSYNDGIRQIERARDYRRLYHFYKNKGDQERAWHFRLLANQSLGQVSKRTLFHRQQGVLAILYNSNDSMDKAEDFFIKAKTAFSENGMEKLVDETETLNQQIY